MGRRTLVRQEQGIAMMIVVLLGAVLSLLGVTLIATVRSEAGRSVQAVTRGAAFQAAEAGLDDYIAKLVDDPQYYAHYVHPGEATRREPGGNLVAAGTQWPYDLEWTYPLGADAWRQLSNGYEYSLQVTPPSAGSQAVRIVAAGRETGSTTDVRVVEALVRPSSLADFFRVVDGDVGWGSGATTNGKLYANGDIRHDGTATADIYAEGTISGSYRLQNGAQAYDYRTIRTQIKNPINFNSFLASFVDIQRASQLGGLYLDDPSYAAWRLQFQAGGTVHVQRCNRVSGRDVADQSPSCVGSAVYPVPANGAVYVAQTVIVDGQVDGRVTVASNDEIVIGGNIAYLESGDDVLGLAATNNLVIARWAPRTLTWRAAVLSQSGTWRTYSSGGSHNTMNFTGMAATRNGGSMTMFDTRNYDYDQTLLYLPPPWFPTVEEAYTVVLFRELPGGTVS